MIFERLGSIMPTKLIALLLAILVSSTQLLATPKIFNPKPSKVKFMAGKVTLNSGTQINVYADYLLQWQIIFLK